MSYFAEIENNIVTNVIVAEQDFINRLLGEWVETFLDGSKRFNYAGIGYTYDPIDDAFIPPVPCDHTELILNDLKRWECETCAAAFKSLRDSA